MLFTPHMYGDTFQGDYAHIKRDFDIGYIDLPDMYKIYYREYEKKQLYVHVVSLQNDFAANLFNRFPDTFNLPSKNAAKEAYDHAKMCEQCNREKEWKEDENIKCSRCYVFCTLPYFMNSIFLASTKANLRENLSHSLGLEKSWIEGKTLFYHFIVPLKCLFSPHTHYTNPYYKYVKGFKDRDTGDVRLNNRAQNTVFSGRGQIYPSSSDLYPGWAKDGTRQSIPELILAPCDNVYTWTNTLQEVKNFPSLLFSVPYNISSQFLEIKKPLLTDTRFYLPVLIKSKNVSQKRKKRKTRSTRKTRLSSRTRRRRNR